MTNTLFHYRKLVAFLLMILFCAFALFMLPVLQAEASVIVLGTAAIAVLGTLLLMGGITFASTQDMSVGVNGFYSSMQADERLAAMSESILANAPGVDSGMMQLTEDLSTGWSYFWEHASDYFGVETGVKPDVPIDTSQSDLFLSTLVVNGNHALSTYTNNFDASVCNNTSIVPESKKCSWSLVSPTATAEQRIPYLCDPVNISFGNTILSLAYKYDSSKYGMIYSLDGWNTVSTTGVGYGAMMGISALEGFPSALQVLYTGAGNFQIYSITSYVYNNKRIFSRDKIIDTAEISSIAGTADGSICPDYDTDSEDTLYTGQDVFGTMDEVLDAQWQDVLINIGDVLADLEKGIGKDIAITPTQTDVIPDEIAKELDKPVPTPTPQPSASPSPSPKPDDNRDFPKLPADISKYFPFSLPFDLVYLIGKMQADPEAPKFVIPIDFSFVGIEDEWVIDMGDFETVVVVFRWTVTIGFLVSLLFITRKLMM